ncbi:hypothetical protein [Persicobacter diffluens]|uniref:Uncharacterized protein n=1 Tax=Persicobacter diffluens TaxID=981 RepID=A0AAN5AL60_9BACT|nr:hypothetical protein PEDI_30690 [Persicobacter diffluens]
MKLIKQSMILSMIFLICSFNNRNPENPEKSTLFELFALAPITLFDGTSEGITIEEKKDLCIQKESDSWKITYLTDEKMEVTCKYPSSSITLFTLERKSKSPILVAFTVNERNTSVELWEKDKGGNLEKVELLPTVHAKDFFFIENQFDGLSKYNNNVYYSVDTEKFIIGAGLYTWMEKEFEFRPVDFQIELKWDGEKFYPDKQVIVD